MTSESLEPRPRQMEDELPMGKLLLISLVALLIGGAGVAWAWGEWTYARRVDLPDGPAPIPAQAGNVEQGILFQPTFDQLREAGRLRDDARARLESYGWSDRGRGLVHVPVEQAVDLFLRGAKP